MKFLIILFLLFLGYRVFRPKTREIELEQRDHLKHRDDSEYVDYEEIEE